MTITELAAVSGSWCTSMNGYWCVVCGKFLPADDDGFIVHDEVDHPADMTFDDDKQPQ